MTLTDHLDQYLRVRRRLGYDLRTSERILRRFTNFADSEGAAHIDAALFLRWHATLADAQTTTRLARLSAVRTFARWLHGADPNHKIPPRDLLPGSAQRPHPHIYTEREVSEIVDAARKLPSIYGLRGLTFSTLFGLIAVTGMRVSEALALDLGDFDCVVELLHVRHGKFKKERFLPLEPSVSRQLNNYVAERDRILGHSVDPLFVQENGMRVSDCSARYSFAQICCNIGLRKPVKYKKHGRGPRIHDLRHTFAVRTLVNWYRNGKDPTREMIRLTTYLGHQAPANTYWYLEAVPELLELAMERATTETMGAAQ